MKITIKRVLLLRLATPSIKQVKHPRGPRFPYALKYIEAILKRSLLYDVKFIDADVMSLSLADVRFKVSAWRPDMIILSTTSRDLPEVLNFSHLVKASCAPLIVGIGQDATARPEKYIFEGSPIDIVLRGDPELECLALIEKFSKGENPQDLRTFYLNQKFYISTNLDILPFPEVTPDQLLLYRHIYPVPVFRRQVWGHIITSRGCPYPCMFCTETIRETTGSRPRFRSPINVVDEMECLAKQGANVIIFDDDNLTTSSTHVESLCREIIRRKLTLPWVAHARIDNVTDAMLDLMKKAGCVLLRFGIESGVSRIARLLEKTSDGDWNNQAKRVFSACRRKGIGALALFIIGSPTETEEDVYASMRLAQELDPELLQVSFFTLYPDTKAFPRLRPQDDREDFSQLYHFSVPVHGHNVSSIHPRRLRSLQREFYQKILLRPKFMIRHFIKYALFYLYNPEILRSLVVIEQYFKENKMSSVPAPNFIMQTATDELLVDTVS